jgi:hypothetical protein
MNAERIMRVYRWGVAGSEYGADWVVAGSVDDALSVLYDAYTRPVVDVLVGSEGPPVLEVEDVWIEIRIGSFIDCARLAGNDGEYMLALPASEWAVVLGRGLLYTSRGRTT